jgi:hypothetical protein
MAIWSGSGNRFSSNRSIRTWPVVDDRRLPQRFTQIVRHHARKRVGAATRRDANQQTKRPARESRGRRALSSGRQPWCSNQTRDQGAT